MHTEKNAVNSENPLKPPQRDVFVVKLLGLPLNLKENLVCGLVIVLAILLQIRFQNTLWGEGWFALIGFVGYVAIRLWFLNRRYPAPGELILEEESMRLPESLNYGLAETVRFADLTRVIAWYFQTKGGGQNLTSIEFSAGNKNYRVNWLAIDLNVLTRALQRRGIKVIRAAGSYDRVITPGCFVFIFILLLFIIRFLAKSQFIEPLR